MTKKDYRLLAGVLWRLSPEYATGGSCGFHGLKTKAEAEAYRLALKEVIILMAYVLATDNDRFNQDRFIRACEFGKEADTREGCII